MSVRQNSTLTPRPMNTAGLNKDDRYEDRLEEDWA